jgi:tetratricopeptide (TPR) repeat protein
VLRAGLAGRRDIHGVEHAGYALGLEPLVELLLRRGKMDEVLEAIEAAAANFPRNGHPRLASALALRAELLKAVGSDEPPFENRDELPDDLIEQLASNIFSRVGETDPVLSRQVLAELVPLPEERLADVRPLLLDVLAASANLERELGDEGDPGIRQQAIQRVLEVHDRQGRPGEALQAVLGLALALGDAGQQDKSLAAYEDALGRADRLGEPGLQAQVRRNYGLYLADLHRDSDAESQLRLALARVLQAGDAELLGRCQVALGTFLQHGGNHEEAPQLLREALRQLDPAHPNAVCARSHLNALESGQACSCGDSGKVLAEALQAFALARLPAACWNGLTSRRRAGTSASKCICAGSRVRKRPGNWTR